MPRRLVIDVDTGVDDALALLYALRHASAEVAGIGTVAGNADVERATANTLRVLEIVGHADVPVARGCAGPLFGGKRGAGQVHGDDGLGNSDLPLPRGAESGEHAVDQFIRLAVEAPGTLTLVALGPLTNVALAVVRMPGLARLVDRLVVMGGAFAVPGNVTPAAEFNIWADPEAARIVFEAGFNLTVVPLDVTTQALLTEEQLDGLGDSAVARFSRAIARHYLDQYAARYGRRAAAMHDPLAMAIALDRSLMAECADLPVAVETGGTWMRGATLADRRVGKPDVTLPGKATVCFGADMPRFFAGLLAALR